VRVWILSQDGKPVPVTVQLGITDGSYSEVVDGDLKEEMQVIVEDLTKKKSQGQSGPPSPFGRGVGR
jgi:HlyD family secretion protein